MTTIEQRQQNLQERLQHFKENNSWISIQELYRNGRVLIHLETLGDEDDRQKSYTFESSVHSSGGMVRITPKLSFDSEAEPEWEINWSSGGAMEEAEPEEIAEAMKVMFEEAENLLRTIKGKA